jgi:hypothetical protein
VHGRAVLESDGLLDQPVAGIDLPMRGIDLGEARARAIADELQHVAVKGAVAGKVDNRVPVRLPAPEQKVSLPPLPSSTLAPAPLIIVSPNAEPMAFSMEARVSLFMPSAETWSARLISTARADVAYDTASVPSPPKIWSEPSRPPSSTLSKSLP